MPQGANPRSLPLVAAFFESRSAWLVVLLTALYLGLLIEPLQKILWHDELFTFYIAQSPSLAAFRDAIKHNDWQPPLIFASVWLSHQIFGVSSVSTRLPSVLAFYTASMLLFCFLKRYVGNLWAAVPVLLLWFSFYFKYATEARPYGLLFAFFALALFCYDGANRACSRPMRRSYLAGLLLGNAGMMMSHVLAPFSIMAFGIAELIKTVREKKVRWAAWFAIIAPLGLALEYTNMVQGFQTSYFPPIFQASFRKIAVWYGRAFFYTMPGLLLAVLFGWWTGRGSASAAPTSKRPLVSTLQEPVLLFSLMLPPILINLLMMRSGGAFWERYCITSAVSLYVILGLGVGWLLHFRRPAALGVVAVLAVVGSVQSIVRYHAEPQGHPLVNIRPDLPMVAASGLAFLEMDYYEPPVLLQHLFYLTNREAAIRYAHATLFEDMGRLHNYFPIRAHVEHYGEFITAHKHFTVFGTQHYSEDWLLEKLADDGASVKKLQNVATPYRDYTVYDVEFR